MGVLDRNAVDAAWPLLCNGGSSRWLHFCIWWSKRFALFQQCGKFRRTARSLQAHLGYTSSDAGAAFPRHGCVRFRISEAVSYPLFLTLRVSMLLLSLFIVQRMGELHAVVPSYVCSNKK